MLCCVMPGRFALSCPKNFIAQSDPVLFCASDNKRLELEHSAQSKPGQMTSLISVRVLQGVDNGPFSAQNGTFCWRISPDSKLFRVVHVTVTSKLYLKDLQLLK